MAGDAHYDPLPDLERSELEEAVSTYERSLAQSRSAVQYLAGRGFTQRTVERFRLGYVADSLAGHMGQRGMLAIPFLAGEDRHPVMMRFRCFEDHDHRAAGHGKYMQPPGSKTRMFNAATLIGTDVAEIVHFTEGEMDALILEQLGYRAVAVTGAKAFKRHHAIMLQGFPRVFIWGDGDKAGHEFAAELKAKLRGQAVLMNVPDGEDVNSLFLKYGRERIDEMIQDKEGR